MLLRSPRRLIHDGETAEAFATRQQDFAPIRMAYHHGGYKGSNPKL
jgi:hypothetical protein